ncbi:YfhO family protein [Butyrivibrio proteoclasticus]|uniref:YfhO family protein n=1 Tax=Butyrivibrio proteoclasticus TaxID=43305 RepID=UPI00047E150F|nr:YfhO family protein [Butyrivibrio proteoclasticus]
MSQSSENEFIIEREISSSQDDAQNKRAGDEAVSKEVKKASKRKSYYTPVIMFFGGFLMYVLSILPILISRGLPFFYYGDYNVQQIPFYILAHRAVKSGQFFWNWNADLGGTMFGDFAFYLWGSPFFWITTLFNESTIPYLMPFLMALKYATASCTAYLYLKKHVNKYIYAMIGGFLYAFSGFNACNIVFNHFTDSVCFFPLFLLAFDNLMALDDQNTNKKFVPGGKRFILFALMTAIMSIINYYFFFGQVLFLIIYFIVRYVRYNKLENSFRMFNRALFGGVFGVLLAGFFLMQAYAGIQGNSRLDNFINGYNIFVYPSEKLLWDILKSVSMITDIIGKGTLFYTTTVKNASLAAYIPMFGVSGVVAFFLLNKKKKNWMKDLFKVCVVFAAIPVLNASFSMFNSSYYARWFYMPVLLMCLMTAKALERGNTPQIKKGVIVAVSLFLFFVAVYFIPSTDDNGKVVYMKMAENKYIFLRGVLGTAILCLMLLLIVFAIPKKFIRRAGQNAGPTVRDRIFLFATIIACIVATFVPVKNSSTIITDKGKKMWQEQMLFNKVYVDDSSFARGEVDSTSTNYDMVWGIPSIHCFLSTVPSEIFDFLKGTGDITRTVETNIPTDRVGLKAILSARYYFENASVNKNRIYEKGEGTEGYYFINSQDGFDVFENLNYIPMGFAYDYYITESEWEDLEIKDHDMDLSRVLIISDEDALKYGDSLAMDELTAEDLTSDVFTYENFTAECTKRKATACTSFEPDTYGFSATTAALKDSTLVFFSVPNTKGFSCTVDGVDTPILTADYGLMAIPVYGGVHEIRVTYTPEGFKSGLVMSVTGLMLLVIYGFATVMISKKEY